jgi:hypothetical protein
MRNESSMISCRSPSSVIECPISVNMSVFKEQNYDFFGLSRISSMNYSMLEPERHQYYMYPRSEDNSRWLNRSQPLANGRSNEDLAFCYSNRCNGVRVTDLDCFADLSNLFSSCIQRLIVPIDGRDCDLFGYLNFD